MNTYVYNGIEYRFYIISIYTLVLFQSTLAISSIILCKFFFPHNQPSLASFSFPVGHIGFPLRKSEFLLHLFSPFCAKCMAMLYVFGLNKHTLLCALYIFIHPFNSYENYVYGNTSLFSHEYM